MFGNVLVAFSLLASTAFAQSHLLEKRLIENTVRISVSDLDGKNKNVGSGTIVDRRDGEALALSCGHIFMDTKEKCKVFVTTFKVQNGVTAACIPRAGVLLDYNLDTDTSLVSFRDSTDKNWSTVASFDKSPKVGSKVVSCGCSLGENPTCIWSEVTKLNKYHGAPNIEIRGAAQSGRSGCGIFTEYGQLFAVCYAADHEDNETLCSGLENVYAILGKLNLPKGTKNVIK